MSPYVDCMNTVAMMHIPVTYNNSLGKIMYNGHLDASVKGKLAAIYSWKTEWALPFSVDGRVVDKHCHDTHTMHVVWNGLCAFDAIV